MKYFLTIITICLFTLSAWAQPVNDDCANFIDLGTAPLCTDDIYTNVNATPTVVGGGSPTCFNGITPSQDVFFAFTVGVGFTDLTITVSGSALGPNGVAISNPEVALYRGDDCNVLAELFCANSGVIGNTIVRLDALNLTAGSQYFIRINNASSSATPFWGDFQVCVEEYVPDVIMGEQMSSDACFGTIFDSGGADDDYSNDENATFTICPSDISACIALDVASFNVTDDTLNIYAGSDINAPIIASLNNMSNGNDFIILASSSCVTLEFISDGSVTGPGFEISWQCDALACDGSSFDNPTPISGIPYNNTNLSTCGEGATFNQTPCNNNAFFLNGPEIVLEYTSEGGHCATVDVIDAAAGTGVLVLSGLPDDPGTVCLASSATGSISNVNFEEPGVYYIVVANPFGCTDFGLSIQEAVCALSPALVDALCNPLNGCVNAEMTSSFTFREGFGDIPFTLGVNDGCWGGNGLDGPNYVWFSVQAAEDGPFGFILEGANFSSDIDFNVWGPFTVEEVCETPQVVTDAATNTQPIRSSYAGGQDPTGLADVHPSLGHDIEDVYDCDGVGDDLNDDFVQTIDAQQGEVYIVLVNDWQNVIEDETISIDWSPSDPNVIGPVASGSTIAVNDTSVCTGEPVLIEVITGVDNIEWIGDNIDELSCTDCFSPTATPTETAVYQAVLNLTCYIDTISITVNVFDLDAGPDWTICLGEEFQIPAGDDFTTATYTWSPPAGLDFDCTDCGEPIVIAQTPGVYEVPVTLVAEACSFMDMVTITVLDNPAPTYTIAENQQICAGETVAIGGDPTDGHNYNWTSVPPDTVDPISNPLVTPMETTTYYLEIGNSGCPVTSLDSVTITVVQLPILGILASTDTICNRDTLSLENSILEDDVIYTWTGQGEIFNPDSVFTLVFPSTTGSYTLVGERMGCFSEEVIDIEVINIDIDLLQPDTVLLCFGEEVTLSPFIQPIDTEIQWNQADIISNTPTLSPNTNTTYIATVTNDICVLMDTLYIQVDSIPVDMTITADPEKDSYCQGELVQLTSPIYEPANYPHIDHQWEQIGMETSDTLYNFVLTTVDTFTYTRTTTSGACSQIDTITLNVITNNMAVTPAFSEICPGESVDLLVTADTLGVIEWTPTDGLSCTDCPNPTATPNSTISYTVSTEVDGCPVEASATINVLGIPVINLIDDLLDCPEATIDLNLANSESGTTYVWSSSTDPGFTSAEASINVTVGATTTYTLTATNICGEVTDSVTIEQVTVPTITMPDDLTVCFDLPITLEAQVTDTEYVTSLTWIYDGESEVGNPAEFLSAATSDIATFNVEYSGDNGACEIIQRSLNVIIEGSLAIDLIEDQLVCDAVSFDLNGIPAQSGTTYAWTSSADAGFSSADASINVSAGSVATYTLMVSSVCGEATDNVTIEQVTVPAIIMPSDLTICAGLPITLEAEVTDAEHVTSLTWTYDGESEVGNPAEFLSAATSSIATFNVEYSGDNGACEIIQRSLNVIIEGSLAIDLIEDQLVCDAVSFDLNGIPAQSGTTYAWTSSADAGFSSADASINVTAGSVATYTLMVSSVCGEATDNVTIEQVTIPIITMPSDLTICAGLTFDLEAALANAENVTSQVWIYDGESEVGNPSSFVATLTGGIASFEVEYGVAGETCSTLSEIVGIDVQDEPMIDLLPDTTICFNNEMSFVLNAADENTNATYIWSSAQDATFSNNEYAPVVMPTTTTTYDLEASVGDCSVSGSVTITILSPETLTVGEDQIITDANTEAILEASLENDTPGDFVWIFNDAIVLSMANGAFTPDTVGIPGYVYLTYTNACETLTDSIFIQSTLYQVPNIFSPNGDMVNAVFKPFFAGEMDMVELTVFNRWGQLVFESTDPANPGWDGMVDDNLAPSDVYIYILRIGLDGIVQEEKGSVTLVR